nr:hypothetical protein [Tanacetum cinerariifolium]
MNTKFVNNLPPYWAKYVTNVKNNKDISATTYVELYTYLKSYEPHALKILKKQAQSSNIVDPLAYLTLTTHHLTPTQPTNPPPSTSSLTLPPQPAAQSCNDAMLETMNQIVNLLSGFQKKFPPTNNQLRTLSNSRSHATVHDGQIVTETVHRKALGNVGNTGTRGTQSYGQVHTDDNQIFDNLNHLLAHEMHQEEHLDSDVESDINDNTIPYHQYQLDSEVQDVPTKEQSMVNDSLRAELARCKLEIQTVKRNKVKHDLDTTIVQRNKQNAELEQENVLLKSNLSQNVKSITSLKTKSKKVLSENKDIEERYLEEIVCLKNDNKVATEILQNFQKPTQTIPMLTKRSKLATHDLHKIALGSSNPWYAKQAKIAQPTLYDGHALLKPTNTPVRVHDSEESLGQAKVSRTKMSNRPWTIKLINYAELNDLYSHFVPQKELFREQVYWLHGEELATQKSNTPKPLTPFLHNRPAPIFEINQLKEQLQAKDDTVRKLQTQINIMNVLNVEPTVGSFDKQALETELTQLKDVITSVRIQNDRKITTLTAKNSKLKSESLRKMHSEPIVPEKPKVLTPGMYAISSKYIVPPQRVNRAKPTP